MDRQQLLFVGAAMTIIRKRKKQKRRWWVHPLISSRLLSGQFYIIFKDLLKSEEKFFEYFRMSIASFEELLFALRNNLSRRDTNMRRAVPPEERLALTLRYLATGCAMRDLHFSFRLGISTVSAIVQQTCSAIWNCLKDSTMPIPSTEEWLKNAELLEKNTNFPNCLGAIDGKHMRMIKPEHSGSLFYNYKHFFSIVLLAVADANYCFTFIDVGAYGKSGDSTIFKESAFGKKLARKELNIPDRRPLPNDGPAPAPFVFLGDEAFGLAENILRPYSSKNLTVKKRAFNYRLCRARRLVECSFGILSNKWRIFHRPMNVKVELAESIVKACCILHNFVRRRDGYRFQDTLSTYDTEGIQKQPSIGRTGYSVRDQFADYFVSQHGQLPWQYEKI